VNYYLDRVLLVLFLSEKFSHNCSDFHFILKYKGNMADKFILAVFFFLCCLDSTVTGSKMKFVNVPNTVEPSLTSNLTLRCSLEDTNYQPSGAIVGRDITNTTTNYPHVTAITIMRDNSQHVASLTPYGPPTAALYHLNMNVTGSVSGSTSERGYLEIYFSYPTLEQCGEYFCDISAVTDQGHHVVFSTSLEVKVAEMNLDDITGHVHDLQVKNDKLENELQSSKNEINSLKGEVTSLKGQLHSQSNQINSILSTLTRVQHIEEGMFNCNPASSSSRSVSHTFTTPYDKAPHLHLSVTHLDYKIHTSDDNPEYKVSITHLDATSFTITCYRQTDIYYIYDFYVSWISFSKQ
jgi:FtsZ-binding cell division protein ZapB